jgi:hypothetical protein
VLGRQATHQVGLCLHPGVLPIHLDEEVTAGARDDEADELLWYDVTELDDVRSFFR